MQEKPRLTVALVCKNDATLSNLPKKELTAAATGCSSLASVASLAGAATLNAGVPSTRISWIKAKKKVVSRDCNRGKAPLGRT